VLAYTVISAVRDGLRQYEHVLVLPQMHTHMAVADSCSFNPSKSQDLTDTMQWPEGFYPQPSMPALNSCTNVTSLFVCYCFSIFT